ncbi:unnamed protein product [Hydatigera taeniaeformis]|uniref:Protein kinase domain-containing protein n=1 Tax=Hydatigena taeniaeformis TaxID=6205 RepID=A0A0R3WPX1_HYDTA|nr:unnamed protein product [Hydatigera taeniaeformis]
MYRLTDFDPVAAVAEDSNGPVTVCRNKKTGRLNAVQQLKIARSRYGISSNEVDEITKIKKLNHPNIANLEQIIADLGETYLIYECLHFDLRTYMDIHNKNTGLPSQTVKILWYYPLEILFNDSIYNCAVDMWSLGCIFAEMSTGVPLFPGDSRIDQILCIFQTMGLPTEKEWDDVSKMLPNDREAFLRFNVNKLDKQRALKQLLGLEGFNLLKVSICLINSRRTLPFPVPVFH